MTTVLDPNVLALDPTQAELVRPDLTVEVSTSELVKLEAELIFQMIDGPGLTDAERYRLVAVERELDRRWSLG